MSTLLTKAAQFGLSDTGFLIVSKISLDGMSRYVLVVYAHAIDDLVTAVLAILFERTEKLNISKRSAQEKTAGTLVALGGAILSTV
ncbi:hypothetical protein WN943_004584 [Citrus x changshan-huyou]